MNNVARSLKISRTFTIGFITPEIANDFFMTVAQGVEDRLKEEGYSVIICNSNELLSEEKARIDLLLEKCVDGIIIIPCGNSGSHLRALQKMNVPLVLVDRLAQNCSADAVVVDNREGSFAAVEHLIGEGYRSFGFIGGNIELSPARERYEGFFEALKKHGIACPPRHQKTGNFHEDSGYALMKDIISQKDIPEIVFIANYYMHIGAVKYLIQDGSAKTKLLKIASFDDMALSSVTGYAVLTISQPILEIGKQAAAIMLCRIKGEELPFPSVTRLKTTLIPHELPQRYTIDAAPYE